MDLSDITLTGLMRRNSEASSANSSPTFLPASSTTAELAEEKEGRGVMSTDNGESHSSASRTITTKKPRERDTPSSRQQVNK